MEKPHNCVDCGKGFKNRESLKIHRRIAHPQFCCKVCGKGYLHNLYLQKHLAVHEHQQNPHKAKTKPTTSKMIVQQTRKCTECNKTFATAAQLSDHRRGKHPKQRMPFNCPHCGRGYQLLIHLQKHMLEHKDGGDPYVCSICKKACTSKYNLQLHTRTHTGEKPYECHVCFKKFNNPHHLKNHILRIHTGDRSRSHACGTCQKTFRSGHALRHHMVVHLGERKRVQCHICGKSIMHLQAHLKTHTGEKPFKCSLCDMTFSSVSAVKAHTKTQHAPVDTSSAKYKHQQLLKQVNAILGDSLSCPECSKEYANHPLLQKHFMRFHSQQVRYNCSVCNKGFYYKGDLNTHMLRHTGEKRKICALCGKSLNDTAALTYHMKAHIGEKPFKCQVCGMAFVDAGPRDRHIKTHTGEKPYKCSLCARSFLALGNFRTHVRLHNHFKRFQCIFCEKWLSSKFQLDKHLRAHVGEKPYFCEFCGKSFTCTSTKADHMRSKHSQSVLSVM